MYVSNFFFLIYKGHRLQVLTHFLQNIEWEGNSMWNVLNVKEIICWVNWKDTSHYKYYSATYISHSNIYRENFLNKLKTTKAPILHSTIFLKWHPLCGHPKMFPLRVEMVPPESVWGCMWRGQVILFGCYNEGDVTSLYRPIVNFLQCQKLACWKGLKCSWWETPITTLSFGLTANFCYYSHSLCPCLCILPSSFLDDSRGEIMDQGVFTFYSLFIHTDELFCRNTWYFP